MVWEAFGFTGTKQGGIEVRPSSLITSLMGCPGSGCLSVAEATDLIGCSFPGSSGHRSQGPVLPAALGFGVICGLWVVLFCFVLFCLRFAHIHHSSARLSLGDTAGHVIVLARCQQLELLSMVTIHLPPQPGTGFCSLMISHPCCWIPDDSFTLKVPGT